MEEVSTHEAKTRLSSLISRAIQGEEIVICRGKHPLVRLVAITEESDRTRRPTVGTITSPPVSWSADAFAPLTQGDLEAWGL